MPVQLVLRNGVNIPDATRLVRAKFESFDWAWYDGVVTDPFRIEPVDFAITIAMNSRATADRMRNFMRHRETLENWLKKIPVRTMLSSSTRAGVFEAVKALFEEACSVHGTALAVASKVLHRKRPNLIPMLDSVIVEHYRSAEQTLAAARPRSKPTWFESATRGKTRSDPTVYMRLMAEELDSNRDALAKIRAALAPSLIHKNASDVRLLEAALYAHLQGM